MKKKHKDLQPWLDYFNMLRRHEEQEEDGTTPQGVAPQTPCTPLKSGTAQPDLFAEPEPQAAPSLDDMEEW